MCPVQVYLGALGFHCTHVTLMNTVGAGKNNRLT